MRPPGRMGLSLLVLAAVGCSDGETRIVTVDRDLTTDVPAGAAGFVGYYNTEAKATTCGECHVGQQGGWEGTAHADAWATLEGSGQMQDFCQGCHTTNEAGNFASGPGGYSTVEDDRYHDVQCESCHGPGLEHARTPDRTEPPLASIAAGAESGCGTCHQGDHHPFVEEWSASGHGEALASPAGRAECAKCHAGEDALKEWGVNTEFLEKELLDEEGKHLGITCAVCHDPHNKTEEGQLRFAVDVPDEEENLCMKCHHKRGQPDPTSSRGPHSPQGPMLLGYGGWWPDGFSVPGGKLYGTHSSERNPNLCVGCHMPRYELADGGGVTGHSFQAIPCLDDRGAPLPSSAECADEDRSFQGCVSGNCHGTETAARSAMFTAESRLLYLADELDALVMLVPGSEFSTSDGRYTTGEGAKFNVGMAREPGTKVHNPFLMEALLIASIKQVRAEYGLGAQTAVSLTPTYGLQ